MPLYFNIPVGEEICKTCSRAFSEHNGYPNWPSKPSAFCRGFAKTIPKKAIEDVDVKCVVCDKSVMQHLTLHHSFICGETPETRFEGDLTRFRALVSDGNSG